MARDRQNSNFVASHEELLEILVIVCVCVCLSCLCVSSFISRCLREWSFGTAKYYGSGDGIVCVCARESLSQYDSNSSSFYIYKHKQKDGKRENITTGNVIRIL